MGRPSPGRAGGLVLISARSRAGGLVLISARSRARARATRGWPGRSSVTVMFLGAYVMVPASPRMIVSPGACGGRAG